MPVTFAGIECVDPRRLIRHCEDVRIPVGPFAGRANLFRCPAGRGPGSGAVLMTAGDLYRVALTTDHTLVFEDANGKQELKKITAVAATAVVPGAVTTTAAGWQVGEPGRVYLVELVDRRYHLNRVAFSKAYNLKNADGTGYHSVTTNGGTAWTWDEVGEDIWDTVGGLGTWPGLGWTPHGTPENLNYYGEPGRHWSAWAALNDYLERLAAVPDYDPVADVFTVKRIGSEPSDETTALNELAREPLTWDGDPNDGVRGGRPEKVRVRFLRSPAPTDGNDPWYSVDVTLTATAGVVAGSFVQLEDDMTAIGATGTPSNSAALGLRATDRADDWKRKFEKRDRRLLKVYRDVQTDAAVVVGATATAATWEDRANGLRTELESKPDRALELWHRAAVAPVGGGSETFLVLLTEKDVSGTHIKFSAVEVEASGSITYAVKTGGRTFSTSGTPLYHENDISWPVVGLTAGSPRFVRKQSVVRVYYNPSGFWYFKGHPWRGIFRRTGTTDADGEQAYHRINTANTGLTWGDRTEVRLIEAE